MRSERASIDNRIAALEKRMMWLELRLEGKPKDELSYDRQEHSALKWAIPLLRGMIEGERAEKPHSAQSVSSSPKGGQQ